MASSGESKTDTSREGAGKAPAEHSEPNSKKTEPAEAAKAEAAKVEASGKALSEITSQDHKEFRASDKPAASTAEKALPSVSLVDSQKAPDRKALEKDAEAIRKATGNDNYIARWSDNERIINILKGKSEAEIKVLDEVYRKKYGISIERETAYMSGSDREKVMGALYKKDNDKAGLEVSRVATALAEGREWTGRSQTMLDKDLRDSLRGATSQQIQEMEREYQRRHGISLSAAIERDGNIGKETKEALKIYLKGSDKREAKDTDTLTTLALKSSDLQFFKEVMKDATPADRARFQQNGGDKRLADAFSGNDLDQARDFVKEGKLTAATQVRENTGTFIDNNQGIELALSRMTDDERARYRIGRHLAGKDQELSEADQKRLSAMPETEKTAAGAYYKELRKSLEGAGNSTELARWESLINTRNGSFVASLDQHRGLFWNASTATIGSAVENMSEKDWREAKANPNSRKELETMLLSLNKDEQEREAILKIFDDKMKAQTFAETKDTGRVSVNDKLEENWGIFKNDQGAMLEAIGKMTAAERARYKDDENFRKELDRKVERYLSGDTEREAQRLLGNILEDGKTGSDILTKLTQHKANLFTDEEAALRDIDQALKQDPKLRERLQNPQSEADIKFKADFERIARETLGKDRYQALVPELIAKGGFDLEKMTRLSKGFFSDDEETTYKDIAAASKESRDRLINDKAYRAQALSHLNEEEKKIALAVAAQGEYKPEDKIRQMVLGFGGSKEIVGTLKDLAPEQLKELKAAYALKYGKSFENDLMDKLGGQELAEARRILSSDKDIDTRIDAARDDIYATRSGVGAGFADVFSGTGKQADDTMDELLKTAADAAKTGSPLSPEETRALFENYGKAVDNHRESKSAAADYTADAIIAGGTIASVIATGGTNLPLVAAVLAAGGAATKVGTKSLLMGNDYDFALGTVAKDASIGALTGATSVFGQAQLAAVFKIGQQSAAAASGKVVETLTRKSLSEIAKSAGLSVADDAAYLAPGFERLISEGTGATMRNLLANGATKIEEKAFQEIAEKAVDASIKGALREAAVQAVRKELTEKATEEFAKHTANWLTYQATAQALNAGAGGGANSLTGVLEGLAKWDSNKSLAYNIKHVGMETFASTVAGAGGALAFGGLFKAAELGHARMRPEPSLKASEGPALRPEVTADAKPDLQPDLNRPAVLDFSPGDGHFAAIDNSAAPEGKLWHPQRDFTKLEPAERSALLGRLGSDRSPLAGKTSIESYIGEFDAVARGWDEQMGKLPALKESSRAHLEQATREARALSESLGVPVKDGKIDIEAMRAKANGDVQVEQTIKNYKEKRGVYAALVNAENSQAALRAESLQPVFDKFAQEKGLPPIKIKTGDALSMSGQAAYYRNGELYIHPHYLLDGSRKLDLLELGYHELTHHEHSFTVARSYADALKLNGAPDRNQAEVLSHVFKQQTGQDLSPEAALTFLEKRHSLAKPNLDEAGLARARRLEAALVQNHPVGAKLDDLATSFRVAESALKRLDDQEQTSELIARLYAPSGEGKALSLRLFGSETPPASLTKILGGDAADKVEAAAAELRATITKRMDAINQERRLAYDSYMQDHEVDAFLTGQKARIRAAEMGIKDSPAFSRTSTNSSGIDVSLDRVDAPNLARATRDIIESIKKGEEPAVKPPRLQLGIGKNTGTPSDFNPQNGTFYFERVTINQKLPFSATTSKAQRNLKVGDELNLKLHPDGALDRTPLKVVAINNDEITLSYQGRFEMRAGDAKRHNLGLADDLKAFAVSRMSARIDEPGFRLDSGNPYLNDLLMHGNNLQRADIKLLNQALRAQQFDGQFRYNLLSEVKRRGALGEIDENTGHAWLIQIAERSGASKVDKGKEYLDFFRAMPDDTIARMAKDKIKAEPLQKALSEVVVGSRLDTLSSKERAAVLVKALKATPSREDGGLTNNTAITGKIFKNFEPESLDSLSQADRAMVLDRARALARLREGIEDVGEKSRSEHVAELFGMFHRAEVVSEGTLNRALDKLSPNEVRALREVLEEDKDFLTMSGFNRKIDQLVETLRAHDRSGADRSFIRVAKPNETEALFRNAEIVSVYVNDDDAGRALAYAFRKRSGISVDIHSPSTMETPTANMVLLTRAENVAGSKAEDLINRGQAHLAEAFADFDDKFNFMDIAKAEIAPDIFEAKLKRIAQERMNKSEPAASQSADDRAAIKRLLADESVEEEALKERALLAILRMEQDRAHATAEAFLEASQVVSLRDLYRGAKGLADKLHAGRNPEDFIYVVDGDGEGSGLFVTEIFRQINPRSQYMTRSYIDLHEPAELRGKTFVILDDCVYSGSSAIKHAGLVEDLTKRFDGTRAVVGTIDAHTEGLAEFAANRHNLATKGEQKLAQLVVANDTRPDFKQAVRASLVRMKGEELATPEALEALTAKSEKAQWSKSPLVSGMIYPHMLPNNNPDEFNRLMGSVLDRAGAHSESPVRLQRQLLEYGPQNAGRVDELVTRGGSGTREQLDEIIAANNGGIIIDLRAPSDGNLRLEATPRNKTLSPRAEQEYIERLKSTHSHKYDTLEYHPLGLSTSADKQLTADQVEQFLALMDRANKEGIPVYVHCEFGRDRTGLMIGLYRMWQHRQSAEKAWEEALAYGFNRNLVHMANKFFELEL